MVQKSNLNINQPLTKKLEKKYKELKMQEKKRVNILGTCIMRDIFRYDMRGLYDVDRFVQNINPISAVANSPLLKVYDEKQINFSNSVSNFYRRNIKFDFTKKVFDYLDSKADFFLVDAGDARRELIEFSNGAYVTCIYKSKIKEMRDKGFISGNYGFVHFSNIADDVFEEAMGKYVQEIKKVAAGKRIVLFETKSVSGYFDVERKLIRPFASSMVNQENADILRCYKYLLEHLPEAVVIPMPQNNLGITKHIWGTYTLHYVPEYYEYAFEAFCCCDNSINAESEISKLMHSCEKKIKSKYYDVAESVGEKVDKYINSSNWYYNALTFFEKVVNDSLTYHKFDFFLEKYRGKSIAILKSKDKAGKLTARLCYIHGVNLAFSTEKYQEENFSMEEKSILKSVDLVIDCNLHGKDKIGFLGNKLINVNDILE